jgi:hypothetical protein
MSAFDTTSVRFGAGFLGFGGLAGWNDWILQDFLFNNLVLAVSFSIFDFPLLIFRHSILKLFVGFAMAALVAWKLIVIRAISNAITPAKRNNHQCISTL